MITRKDGIIHSRISFSILEEDIELYNDEVEKFFCYTKFSKRVNDLLAEEILKSIKKIPNMTNARIDIVLTYMTNPDPNSLNYPYEVKVIKK